MRRFLVCAMVLSAMTLVVRPPAAFGCSFVESTEAEYLARADVVFEGVAGPSRHPDPGAPSLLSGDPVFWTFTVDRQIKGSVAPVQEVASVPSEAACGMRFEEGVRYRVFATYDGAILRTGLPSGTRPAPATPSTTVTSTTAPTTAPPPASPRSPRRITLTG